MLALLARKHANRAALWIESQYTITGIDRDIADRLLPRKQTRTCDESIELAGGHFIHFDWDRPFSAVTSSPFEVKAMWVGLQHPGNPSSLRTEGLYHDVTIVPSFS